MTPIFAADWLNISINLLLVIHVIVCLLLALVVLMQRPKQEGLGAAFGGGLTDQAFGAQTTNVLQKGTVYLGTLFFVITLVLAILIGKQQASDPSMAKDEKEKQEEADTPASDSLNGKKPEVTVPEIPEKPAGEPIVPETPVIPEAPKTPEVPEPPKEPATPETTEGAATGAAIGAAAGGIIGEQPKKDEPKEAPAAGDDQ